MFQKLMKGLRWEIKIKKEKLMKDLIERETLFKERSVMPIKFNRGSESFKNFLEKMKLTLAHWKKYNSNFTFPNQKRCNHTTTRHTLMNHRGIHLWYIVLKIHKDHNKNTIKSFAIDLEKTDY